MVEPSYHVSLFLYLVLFAWLKCTFYRRILSIRYSSLSGTLPFSEDYGTPVAEQIKKGDFSFTHSAWRSVSQVAKTLIMEMLTVNYNQRPNIDYILRHKWLKDPEVVRLGRNLMKEQMTKSAVPELNSDNENFLEPPVKRRRCWNPNETSVQIKLEGLEGTFKFRNFVRCPLNLFNQISIVQFVEKLFMFELWWWPKSAIEIVIEIQSKVPLPSVVYRKYFLCFVSCGQRRVTYFDCDYIC